MYSFLTLVFIIATADMSSAGRRARIFGGNNTSIYMFPYHASLERDGRYGGGGSIISAKFVLTAGHCVAGVPMEKLQVRVGSTYVGARGVVHRVAEVILHEGYSKPGRKSFAENDIALVRVEPAIELDFARQTVGLVDAGEPPEAGRNATIIGWGYNRHHFLLPLYLQEVGVRIVDTESCSDSYKPKIGPLRDGYFCAGWFGQGGRDACDGDSGGALVIDGRQAGIISWGESCALPEYPTIYTDVAYHRQWIQKHSGV